MELRRDERPAPSVEELIEAEPGEPREVIAARHTIAQLNRAHATLNSQHDAYAAAYIEEIARHKATELHVAALEARLLASQQRGVMESARAAGAFAAASVSGRR